MPLLTENSALPQKETAAIAFSALAKAYGSGLISAAAPLSPAGQGSADLSLSSAVPSLAAALHAQAQNQALAQNTVQNGVMETRVSLTSNSQFVEVLRQAAEEKSMVAPQRLAIELQTPPGATVTVFFSQVNGQIRAQLSASDPSSLQWLQQQLGTLKQNESGPNVVWLPPQLDDPKNNSQNENSRQGKGRNRAQSETTNGITSVDSLFSEAEAGAETAAL